METTLAKPTGHTPSASTRFDILISRVKPQSVPLNADPKLFAVRKSYPDGITEKHFDVLFAKTLTELLHPWIVLNGEDFCWIEDGINQANYRKPDFNICHPAAVQLKIEPLTNDPTLKSARESHPDLLYGIVADFRLRDAAILVESKLDKDYKRGVTDMQDYLGLISGECLGEKKGSVTRFGMVATPQKFYLMRCDIGVISMIFEGNWESPGTGPFIREFLLQRQPRWTSALDNYCDIMSVKLDNIATTHPVFLGMGSTGRVFRVKQLRSTLALKIADKEFADVLKVEFETMAFCKGPGVVAVRDFRVFPDGCAGYLLEEVGTPATGEHLREAVQALRLLHRRKISHGDSRIHNLIHVRGEYKWIDMKGQLFIRQTVSNDLASLYSSLKLDVLTIVDEYLNQIFPI